MKKNIWNLIIFGTILLFITVMIHNRKHNPRENIKTGEVIDCFNGVAVYYNGAYNNVSGRNWTKDNYNLGLKYQCVEFVKRYYYEHLNHKMPFSYGHAKDFFDKNIKDGAFNKKRGLNQYHNKSNSIPKVNDILIFDGSIFNKFGHVAIISNVKGNEIEIVQQNTGSSTNSREILPLKKINNKWVIDNYRVLGWLRKKSGSG